MSRDAEYYERKVKELHQENEQLRSRLGNSACYDPPASPYKLVQLQSHNEKLARKAKKYEQSIKGDLSRYLSESTVRSECFFRNRYTHLLNAPQNHYKLHF